MQLRSRLVLEKTITALSRLGAARGIRQPWKALLTPCNTHPALALYLLLKTHQTLCWAWGRPPKLLGGEAGSAATWQKTTDNGRALVAIRVLMRKSQAEPCDVDAYPWTRRHRGAWEQCGCSPSPPSPSAICVCQGYLVVLGIWTSDNSATKVHDKAERPSLRCSLLKTSSRKSLRIRYIFFFCDNVLKLDPPQRILNDRLAELNSVNYEKNLLCAKRRVTFDDSLGFFLTISWTLHVKNVIHIKFLQSDGEWL